MKTAAMASLRFAQPLCLSVFPRYPCNTRSWAHTRKILTLIMRLLFLFALLRFSFRASG